MFWGGSSVIHGGVGAYPIATTRTQPHGKADIPWSEAVLPGYKNTACPNMKPIPGRERQKSSKHTHTAHRQGMGIMLDNLNKGAGWPTVCRFSLHIKPLFVIVIPPPLVCVWMWKQQETKDSLNELHGIWFELPFLQHAWMSMCFYYEGKRCRWGATDT